MTPMGAQTAISSPCCAKTMESLVCPWENSHFLVVTSSLCHPNSATFSKGADNLPIRTDKMCPNHSYCAACRCSTTGDVALDAFNSKLFSVGTYFSSLCDPKCQLARHPRLSRRLHPHFSLNNCRGFAATYRTVCYGWRVGIV